MSVWGSGEGLWCLGVLLSQAATCRHGGARFDPRPSLQSRDPSWGWVVFSACVSFYLPMHGSFLTCCVGCCGGSADVSLLVTGCAASACLHCRQVQVEGGVIKSAEKRHFTLAALLY